MVICEYDPAWVNHFEKIKKELQKYIRTYIHIHHIGSTSIPGMYAKPIIDINIEIENLSVFADVREQLEEAGYYHNGDQGIPGREVFKRKTGCNNETLDAIQHHLYVCASGAKEHVQNILFRDYLRNHPEYMKRYNEIKFKILNEYGEDNREKYVETKEKNYRWFFDEVIKLSRAE